MFVLSSDFDDQPYNIPNLDKVINTFADFVDEVEQDNLEKLLGKTLYDAFVEGLESLPAEWTNIAYTIGQQRVDGLNIYEAITDHTNNVRPSLDSTNWVLSEENNKWLRLKKGDKYQYGGLDFRWVGMMKLLRPLIYSEWLETTFDNHTGVGVVVGNNENSTLRHPGRRIMNAYNNYARKAGLLDEVCHRYLPTYPISVENTLYGFITANEADYPDFCFTSPGFKSWL